MIKVLTEFTKQAAALIKKVGIKDARKAYAKKHGSTANRINAKKKQLKNKEAKAKHNRN